GGGGSFIGALIMIVVMIAIIVPTAISALISSLLLITVAKKIFPSLKGLPFKPAFKACFAAILLHAVVFSIAYWISSKIMIALKEKPGEQSIEAMQQYLSPTLST